MYAMHLIRFPNRKEHQKGLMAVLSVPRESLGLPDYQMVVTNEHIQALEAAKVRFEYLSKTAPNGKNSTSV
ncbi:MAG TPA: hypothetical protein VKI17_09240, partial [Gemmataceae bacterium]|nr:hypothetical protein [Gemmataceae bacterium]